MKIALLLSASILTEVAASSSLKLTEGFKKIKPSIFVIACYCLSFYCLSLVLKVFPIGNAYAIWGGLGTVFTCLIGVFYYKENMTKQKLLGISLIILGVIVLNLWGGAH